MTVGWDSSVTAGRVGLGSSGVGRSDEAQPASISEARAAADAFFINSSFEFGFGIDFDMVSLLFCGILYACLIIIQFLAGIYCRGRDFLKRELQLPFQKSWI